jgi:hypothetical protein
MSWTKEFTISDVEFSVHCEQTVELRSGIYYYWINKKLTNRVDFWDILSKVLEVTGELDTATAELLRESFFKNQLQI